ncbi:TPA_asm: UL30.6 sORF [Human alphaherpesvirus 1]|nr:TPA_asm: UL30.6 sORF [Human alphaherpesvirus 1]
MSMFTMPFTFILLRFWKWLWPMSHTRNTPRPFMRPYPSRGTL